MINFSSVERVPEFLHIEFEIEINHALRERDNWVGGL